jgi:hypothetical protein
VVSAGDFGNVSEVKCFVVPELEGQDLRGGSCIREQYTGDQIGSLKADGWIMIRSEVFQLDLATGREGHSGGYTTGR